MANIFSPPSQDLTPYNAYNFLANGAFDFWQATAGVQQTPATGTSTYSADQWYVKNASGGLINYARNAGTLAGSTWAAAVFFGVSSSSNNMELYQVLSNFASTPLYNQTASFAVQVLALGNVTQVGIQFFYATSEAKLTTAIGSEVLTTVNSSTFTRCIINGQALGTAQTKSGVIGVRIRATAVSSGNIFDGNNGYSVEQAIINLGAQAAPFSRQYPDPSQELMACQYFFQKSYPPAIQPGTTNDAGSYNVGTASANNAIPMHNLFPVSMRVVPGVTIYAYDGTAGSISNYNGVGHTYTGVAPNKITTQGYVGLNGSSFVTNTIYWWEWAADARI